jgi:hypothetical protein
MTATYTGDPFGPHLQRSEPVFKRGVGWQTRQTWRGTSEAIRAYIPHWTVDAESIELELSGPEGVAVVTYARDAVGNPDQTVHPDAESETVWELAGNDIAKDLFEHPDFLSLPDAQIYEIKKQIQNFDSGADISLTSISAENQYWFALAIKGTRQFTDNQWVLRRTVTVPRTFQTPVAMTGIGQLWTTAQIQATEHVDNQTLFSISTIEEKTGPGAYLWSWLKKSPTVSRSSSGRFQMVQEWHLDLWNSDIYYEYTP